MPFTRGDLLSAAHRSLAAAGAHDREGWLGLFTADGRVEDPVGSVPHRGQVAIGRFYDTFIGPRDISHHPNGDVVVGTTVVRDVELEIKMASMLTMTVPTYIRYDLRTERDELRIAALSAYWELPAMIEQFARGGVSAVPAGIALSRTMFANQGLTGSLGFLSGFRGVGTGRREVFAAFLDDACGGDEIGMRRSSADVSITLGDSDPLTASDLIKQLSGGTWDKLVGSGHSVAARVDRDGRRSVLIGEVGSRRGRGRATLTSVKLFGDIR